MKIDISQIDKEQFLVHEHIIAGDVCYLVQPQHIGCKFTQQNKIFRSSIWDSEGNLISAGLPKFTNLGENPENFPTPTNLKNSNIINKLDGSLLITSKFKSHEILRTRGTSDATKLENGYELEIFKSRGFLDKLTQYENSDTWNTSFLFEWLTASDKHRIVLKYDNVPEWVLIGAVNHSDYSLWTQAELDKFAATYDFKRPETYNFNSVDELINKVTEWKNLEGVVCYTKNDQCLHKIKSDDYKKKHAFKSNATLDNTLDLFVMCGMPSYTDFYNKIIELYDFECAQMVQPFLSSILDAWKEVKRIEDGMSRFVNSIKDLSTRKLQAERIISSYGGENNNRSGMVFHILNGKPLTNDMYKKLLFQCLK